MTVGEDVPWGVGLAGGGRLTRPEVAAGYKQASLRFGLAEELVRSQRHALRRIAGEVLLAKTWAQVRACSGDGCKTAGSAYVGSNPTPATTSENASLAAHMHASGALLRCPVMCHLAALQAAMLRCPRTHGGRI